MLVGMLQVTIASIEHIMKIERNFSVLGGGDKIEGHPMRKLQDGQKAKPLYLVHDYDLDLSSTAWQLA